MSLAPSLFPTSLASRLASLFLQKVKKCLALYSWWLSLVSLFKAGGWEDYFYCYWPIYAPTIANHHHLHDHIDHHKCHDQRGHHHCHTGSDFGQARFLPNFSPVTAKCIKVGGVGLLNKNITHYTMQYCTIPSNTSQYNTVQYHTIPSNSIQ